MAKKVNKFELDNDYGFSNDLDIPDFNAEPGKPAKDRKPVIKVGKEVLSGAKDTVKSPQFIRGLIKKSLPSGYGSAFGLADEAAGTLKTLYDDTAKELKPAIKEVRKVTKRIMPTVEAVLPKSIAAKIKKWTEADPDRGSASSAIDDQRDASITATLGEIFKMQEEGNLQRDAQAEIQARMSEGMSQKRHTDMVGQLDAMRVSLQQIASYHQRVDSAFKRKSLELQFRHYFVSVDSLTEQKRMNAKTETFLDAIKHNTALPEFDKITYSERFKEATRDRIIEGVFAKRRDFMRNFGGKILQAGKEKISGFADNIRQGAGMVDSLADLKEMREMMGDKRSGAEVAGNMAGSLVAETLGGKIGKFLRKQADKSPGIVKAGNKLGYLADNAPQLMGQWAKGYKGDDLPLIGSLVRMLKDATSDSLYSPKGVTTDSASSMTSPDFFSRQTNKSITEIIPGYLSRIYQELRIMRTGDTGIEMTSYDFATNSFSDKSSVHKAIVKDLVPQYERESTTKDVDDLVAQVDSKGKLTPEQRKILGLALLKDNLNNEAGSKERLTDSYGYQGAAGRHGGAFADVFEEFFADDTTGEKQRVFANQFSRLGSNISEARNKIQTHVSTGNREHLEKLGLLDKGGSSINMNKLYEMFYGEGEFNPGDDGPKRPGIPGIRHNGPGGGGAGPRHPGTGFQPVGGGGGGAAAPQTDLGLGTADHAGSAPAGQTVQINPEALIAAIKDNSSKTIAETINETLLRIEAKLHEGITTVDLGEHMQAMGNKAKGLFGRGVTKGMEWFHKGRKTAQDLIGRATKATASSMWKQGSSLVGGLYNTGKDLAKSGLDWARGKGEQIKDVYIGLEIAPRLQALKLQAGQYRDQATGAIIKSYKDIKGAVIDENGNVVLTAEEVRKAFVKSSLGQKLISAFGAASKFATDMFNKGASKLPKVYQFGVSMVQKAINLLNLPQDIYVKGKADPVLLARTMKAGGYRSRLTGKVLKGPADIDGVVLDDQDNVVLTAEELAGGIYDKNGKAIHAGFDKLINAGLGAVKRIRDTGKKLYGQLKSGAQTVWGKLRGAFGRGKAKLGEMTEGIGFGGEAVIGLLTDIRNLLDARLPQRKRHVVGDAGEDGVRDGSYQDLMNKASKKGDKAEAKTGEKQAAAATAPMGKGLLGTLWDKLRGKKDGESGGGVDINVGGAGKAAETAGKAEKAAAKAAPKGFWGKAGAVAKGVGKGAWWLTKGAGTIAASMLGLSGLGLGGLAAGAGSALAGVGSAALGAGGALLSGAGAVAGGLASVMGTILASPLLLPALAVAAVGVGGYLAYKYLTRKQLGTLSNVRYAQYGFSPTKNDHVQAVFGMEDQLMEAVEYKDGIPSLDQKKVKVEKLMKTFDVSEDDNPAIEKWLGWFAKRFRPVFLAHLTSLRAVNPKVDLADIDSDKLTTEEKSKYLGLCKWPGGPYDVMVSPFPKEDSLEAGANDVDTYVKAAEAELAKATSEKDAKGGAAPAMAATAAAAAAGVTAPGEKAAPTDAAGSTPGGMLKTAAMVAGTAGAAKLSATGLPVAGDENIYQVSMEGADQTEMAGIDKLNALIAIRFKAYGLSEPTQSKVAGLARLENLISRNLKFGKTGASWKGSIDQFVTQRAILCGLENTGETRQWFALRFLPVFLTYVSTVAGLTGKTEYSAAPELSPEQTVAVAQAMVAAKTPNSQSVWSVSASPWGDITLNTDADSVASQMQLLQSGVKEKVLAMDGKTDTGMDKPKAGTLGDAKSKALEEAKSGDDKPGFFGKVGNKIADIYKSAKTMVTGAMSAVADTATGIGSAVAGAFGFGGGKEVSHPGNGSGGDINSLPTPKGKGTWASLKDLIVGAAKMVGVDDKLMATMAAIESGFDYTVKASTSAATGLYQFIPSTWKAMLTKYGAKYGIDPSTPPTDPRANALMGAEFLKENQQALQGAVNRPLTDTDLYLAHFLGAGGAKKLLKASPDTIAANLMPEAAAANKPIFYSNGRALTVGEVYAVLNKKVRSHGAKFGLGGGGETAAATPGGAPAAGGAAATTAAAAPAGGVIPVSDQSPGVTAGGGGVPKAAPIPSGAPAPAGAPTDPAVAAASSGFQPPRAQDATEQAKYQKQVSADSLGTVNSTLQETLGVNRSQLQVLQQIYEVLRNSNGGAASTQGSQPAPAGSAQPKIAQPMTKAPVSMSKATI